MGSTPPTRPEWREYWLGVAEAVSKRGECLRSQVGAIVVGSDNRLKGAGYNGAPAGEPNCLQGACPRARAAVERLTDYDTGAGACIAIHAETNALMDAGRDRCIGGTIYITRRPCEGCRKQIAAAGIKTIIYRP